MTTYSAHHAGADDVASLAPAGQLVVVADGEHAADRLIDDAWTRGAEVAGAPLATILGGVTPAMEVGRVLGVDAMGPPAPRRRAKRVAWQLVLRDADLDAAARRALRVALAPARTLTRVLVHAGVLEPFVGALQAHADAAPAEHGWSSRDRRQLLEDVDDAWTRGASVQEMALGSGGAERVTVLSGVTAEMAIAWYEPAGPAILLTAVATEAEAYAVALGGAEH